MSIEDNIKLVTGAMGEFMSTGNPAKLFASITEEAVIKAVIADGTPISGDFRGKDGFLSYFQALGEVMEILDVQTTSIAGSENSVVMLGTEKIRVKRTGKVFECDIATVFTLDQGKIAKILAFGEMSNIVDAYRETRA